RKNLLHFAIVGAGATGTELAGSLRDFLHADLVKLYPSLQGLPRITLYDVSPTVLPMFDESLSHYAMDMMRTEGIRIKTSHHVESLRWGAPGDSPPHKMDPKGCLTLKTKEEGEEGVGMCVWATGNEMNPFVKNSLNELETFPTASAISEQAGGAIPPESEGTGWKVKKAAKTGALSVDDRFRVQLLSNEGKTAVLQDVFAIGDNATRESGALPATAQVTYQEAKWLGKRLNRRDFDRVPTFSFKNLGVMAYIGDSNALVETPGGKGDWLPNKLKGRTAWLVWRSAYLTMSMSWRNKLRVGFRWFLNRAFGRDISRY
ncbi:FAD-dependent oxidoreductase, partial [Candidatus Bathyarchaeota archaeon]|nr:FAD-dependent oxidoreductase [Candidatus Bathyarchaeota archaeon]